MLFTQFLDDFRSRRRLVADGLSADLFLELFDQLAREPVLVNGKGLLEPHSGHLPMAGGGVLGHGAPPHSVLRTRLKNSSAGKNTVPPQTKGRSSNQEASRPAPETDRKSVV